MQQVIYRKLISVLSGTNAFHIHFNLDEQNLGISRGRSLVRAEQHLACIPDPVFKAYTLKVMQVVVGSSVRFSMYSQSRNCSLNNHCVCLKICFCSADNCACYHSSERWMFCSCWTGTGISLGHGVGKIQGQILFCVTVIPL